MRLHSMQLVGPGAIAFRQSAKRGRDLLKPFSVSKDPSCLPNNHTGLSSDSRPLDDRQKSLAEDMNPYHSPYLFPAVRWSLMDM